MIKLIDRYAEESGEYRAVRLEQDHLALLPIPPGARVHANLTSRSGD